MFGGEGGRREGVTRIFLGSEGVRGVVGFFVWVNLYIFVSEEVVATASLRLPDFNNAH